MSELYSFLFKLESDYKLQLLEALPDESRLDDILECLNEDSKGIMYYTYEDCLLALRSGVLPIYFCPTPDYINFSRIVLEAFQQLNLDFSKFCIMSEYSIHFYLSQSDIRYLHEIAQIRWSELNAGIAVTSDYSQIHESSDSDEDSIYSIYYNTFEEDYDF